MIHILPLNKSNELKNYVDSGLIKRLDESRNIFVALGEKRYFLTFHWLDEKKVTLYADTKDFVLVTDSEGAAEAAKYRHPRRWHSAVPRISSGTDRKRCVQAGKPGKYDHIS